MDLDQYVTRHQDSWYRLRQLTERATRATRRLSPAELDDLLRLYQQTSAQLSFVRTHYGDRRLISDLAVTVAGARAVIYRRRGRATSAVATFFTTTFPAAVWACRWPIVAAVVTLFAPAVGTGWWLANDSRALTTSIPDELQRLYVESRFEDYYSSIAAQEFALWLMLNNVLVGYLAFGLGILACLPAILYLANFAVGLGQMAAIMHAGGAAETFWGLIIPHGLLELTAICLATGAGLHMGWAILVPGDRSRREALAENSGRAIVVALGASACFVVAALIEAFVTPSELPTAARVGLGVAVELLFLTYIVTFGRRAAARGVDGRLGDPRPTWADERDPSEGFGGPGRSTRERLAPALPAMAVAGTSTAPTPTGPVAPP